MSLIVTMRLKGDPEKLESFAAENPDRMRGIADIAEKHGSIAHRFYASDADEILVVDEWPDRQSFGAFFQEARSEIEPVISAFSSTDPEITFWRKLETHDEIGWTD